MLLLLALPHGVARAQQPSRAADALVYGQRPEGGWHYFIDFDPRGTEGWYGAEAARFKWGYEEYRRFYGNATFDDGNSAEAARYLMRFYAATLDAAYLAPLNKALDFFLRAQYPNGAWPQRYPLGRGRAHGGPPDYTSFYTLNDGAAATNVLTLVEAYELLGDERVSKLTREEARAEYEQRRGARRGDAQRQGPPTNVAEIIRSLDARGAWVTDISVLTRVAPPALNPGTRERLRGYSTGVFVRNMRALTAHAASAK